MLFNFCCVQFRRKLAYRTAFKRQHRASEQFRKTQYYLRENTVLELVALLLLINNSRVTTPGAAKIDKYEIVLSLNAPSKIILNN